MPGSAGAQKAELRQTVVPMEATIEKLYESLASVQRQQRYFHTRENRNLSTGIVLWSESIYMINSFHCNIKTVQSTGSRIVWFSIFECLLAVGIALAQVFIIQTFFARSGGKGRI
jgi:hypothetical protein